jgi:PST family polysaccharide transporter
VWTKNLKIRIANIMQNEDVKTLANNFAWLSVLKVIGYIFPLITLPYLAKVIGAEGFGKIAFASAIMVWIQTIADWGFNLTATRDVAKSRENINMVSEIFSNVLWARCILVIVSFIILLLLILLVPKFYENRAVILVTFLMIPGHIFFPDWFFQAIEKMKYITIFNVLIKLIFTIAVFVFIKQKEDYILQPLFISLGYIVCGVLSFYFIIFRWKINLLKPSIREIISSIKRSTDVFINNLAPNLYNSLSIVLLGVWSGSTSTGIFDGGYRFISICNQVLHILEQSFYPFLSRNINKHNVFLLINLMVSTIMFLGLFIGAPLIVKYLLSPEFTKSVWVIRILSFSIFFRAISNVYGKNYLILVNKERLLRNVTLSCSLLGLIIAIPLIFYFSYVGASIAITIGIFLMALNITIFAKKIKKYEC